LLLDSSSSPLQLSKSNCFCNVLQQIDELQVGHQWVHTSLLQQQQQSMKDWRELAHLRQQLAVSQAALQRQDTAAQDQQLMQQQVADFAQQLAGMHLRQPNHHTGQNTAAAEGRAAVCHPP
jgi:hypothetical protein